MVGLKPTYICTYDTSEIITGGLRRVTRCQIFNHARGFKKLKVLARFCFRWHFVTARCVKSIKLGKKCSQFDFEDTHDLTSKTFAPPSLAALMIFGVWISVNPSLVRYSLNNSATPWPTLNMAWLVGVLKSKIKIGEIQTLFEIIF